MIDGHCHLDKSAGTLEEALEYLYTAAVGKGIKEILLLNLPEIAFDNQDVLNAKSEYRSFFHVFPGINPKIEKSPNLINKYMELGASGIKLHPRLHNYKADDADCIHIIQQAGALGLPVLIDCFPDGKNLALGNVPAIFSRIAEQCSQTRIAIGHAGGHHILDALMVAKYYPNVFLDLSFTLLYYKNSLLKSKISFALDSIKYARVFWGTDYPDRPYGMSVDLANAEFESMEIPEYHLERVLSKNVLSFLGIEDLEK